MAMTGPGSKHPPLHAAFTVHSNRSLQSGMQVAGCVFVAETNPHYSQYITRK